MPKGLMRLGRIIAQIVSTRPTFENMRYNGTVSSMIGNRVAASTQLNTASRPRNRNLASAYPAMAEISPAPTPATSE